MRERSPFSLGLVGVICIVCGLNLQSLWGVVPTNVVFILTDNHGAWTLGCYGNPDIRTPHIDKLATEGVRFSRAFCNNAVCSPTRATYLTGLMPSQHGVHNFLSGGRLQVGPEAKNTLKDFASLPEILKAEGYACGLVGKWHLGANLQPQEGLDDYWITMPHGGTSTFHGAQVIENGEIRKEPKYLTQLWTEHACSFIESNIENPFFLFLAYNGPYGLSRYQLESSGNRHAEYYADRLLESFPRGAIHPWQYPNREYFGNPVSIRRYAEELAAVDDGVGAVMQKLEDCGVEGETLVIFAADQGWAGGQHGLWGMGDHTRPVNAFEHSMHIPMIFRHRANRKQSAPGIPDGRVSDLMVSNYDFMPTVLNYLGLGNRMPAAPRSPGRDFSSVLRGQKVKDWDNTVFYEYETLRCVRTEDWKYIDRYGDGYDELYHLAADSEEERNLVDDPLAAERKGELAEKLRAFFAEHTQPKYDLWKGGSSQTRTHVWGHEAAERQEERATRFGRKASVLVTSVTVPPMTLPDGLVAEVAAAPPLTRHPMMASFDDRGRLFVAEAAGVNLKAAELDEQKPNFIRMLEDTNGDGLFDASTVFADNLTFPSGALWHEGALWVTAAPSIWRFEDTDDDGVADRREAIVTGFGYTGNAADLHGPFLHPNGRIFWCHGRKDLEVTDKDGNLIHRGKGARIWSCEPDGSDVQIYAGGGMDNPVEIVFTPEGEIIGDVNLFYGRPRGDVLVHWHYGGAYPRTDQEAVLAEFTRTGSLLEEFYNFGHVAVSGMSRYRSMGGLGDYQDDLFVTHFNTQQVTRTGFRTLGPTFQAGKTEVFLEIDDPDVHLTDVIEDADGTLLVVDTGGWFRNGCPTSQIAKPEVAGAIYRVRKAGLVDREKDARGVAINWEAISTEALTKLLADERFAVRDRAIVLLAGRGDTALKPLRAALGSEKEAARRNAVWVATRIGSKGAGALLRKALVDASASVRHAACNGLWRTRDRRSVDLLADRLADSSPAVQLAAARALGRSGDASAVRALVEYLDQELDRSREHAAIYALIEIGDASEVSRILTAASGRQKARLMWALEAIDDSELNSAKVADFVAGLMSEEESVAEAARQICARHPEWGGEIAGEFSRRLALGIASATTWTTIEELSPLFLSSAEMRAFVGALLASDLPASRLRAFGIISRSPRGVDMDAAWKKPFKQVLSKRDEVFLEPAVAALGKIDGDTFNPELQAIADDVAMPSLLRVKAIVAVGKGGAPLSDASFQLLSGLLTSGEAVASRAEAAGMLVSSKLTARQRLAVAGLIEGAGPVEVPILLKVFERTRDEASGFALVASLEASRSLAAIRPTELRRQLTRYPPAVYAAAKPLLSKLMKESAQREDRLVEVAQELKHGNVDRGRQVFLEGKGACNTCHKIGGQGREVGPDLSRIGRIRTGKDLLESVLFPSATLARDFEPYEVSMADGRELFGVVHRETKDAIVLLDVTGIPRELPRSGIREIRPGTASMMPMGLDQAMTRRELVDLIAWLDSLE